MSGRRARLTGLFQLCHFEAQLLVCEKQLTYQQLQVGAL
jgi:hypothetical protein